MRTSRPRGAHLVGSIPLADVTEVLRTATSVLHQRLRRVPDGELAERSNWIGWQGGIMARQPFLQDVPGALGRYAPLPRVRVKPGVSPTDISFGSLGYADAAKRSYEVFRQLQSIGDIPRGVRFQVSLPTPLASVATFVEPESQALVEPAYERRMLSELAEICRSIPATALAIQWDVALEMAIWEGVWPAWFHDTRRGIFERLVRIGNLVPPGVELGYHLCYGDFDHSPFTRPRDAGNLVKVANELLAALRRPIQFLHIPVPRDRTDNAFFAPLSGLQLRRPTELYLGVVHFTDGVEGTWKRIEAAQQVCGAFGVAAECGLGRRPPETIARLLQIHAEVSDPVL